MVLLIDIEKNPMAILRSSEKNSGQRSDGNSFRCRRGHSARTHGDKTAIFTNGVPDRPMDIRAGYARCQKI